MKKFFLPLIAFFSAAFCLTSCLSGNDEEYTLAQDAAITSFSLGNLNRYFHTKSSTGEDSVYMRTLNCASYTFYIDQTKGEIWNPDSLPLGTDPKAALCNISTKNSGIAYLVGLDEEQTFSNYSSSDSIDFSQPREFYVYNLGGTARRKYTVKVNVHQENGDTCIWTRVLDAEASIARLTALKGVALGGVMYVFGQEGSEAKLYATAEDDGATWQEVQTNIPLAADSYKSVARLGGELFTLSDGAVLKTADGATWQEVSQPALRQIVAASSHYLYAIDADGQMAVSFDRGLTWNREQIDDDSSLLPSAYISSICAPLPTNALAEKLVVCGSRSLADYPDDRNAVVWTKVDEFSAGARRHPWNYVTPSPYQKFNAPRLENLQMVYYDSSIFAVGGSGIGGNTDEAPVYFLRSLDSGLTWAADSTMALPEGVNRQAFAFAVDGRQSMWILSGGTGAVCKGRINRLLWKKEE